MYFEAGFLNDTTPSPPEEHLSETRPPRAAGGKWIDPQPPTALPGRTQAQREGLLKVLVTYFEAESKREAPNQGVTAAIGASLHAAIVKAHKDLNDNKSAQKKARGERDKAVTKLRKAIRGLVIDLESELEADSADWTKFGLIPPARLNRRKRTKEEAAPAAETAAASTRSTESAESGERVVVALAQ